jgi:hypothetical protein
MNTYYTNDAVHCFINDSLASLIIDIPVLGRLAGCAWDTHTLLNKLITKTLGFHRVAMSPLKRDSYLIEINLVLDPSTPCDIPFHEIGRIELISLKTLKGQDGQQTQKLVKTYSDPVQLRKRYWLLGERVISEV